MIGYLSPPVHRFIQISMNLSRRSYVSMIEPLLQLKWICNTLMSYINHMRGCHGNKRSFAGST